MPTNAPRPQVVIADDLSGAAEAAAVIGAGTRVLLGGAGVPEFASAAVVIDLDTRAQPGEVIRARHRDVLGRIALRAPVVKKVDSLLRGDLAAEIAALVESGRFVVLAPALPALDRTTIEGVVREHGVPIDRTDLWAAEGRSAPGSVADAIPGLRVTRISLDAVRSEVLSAELASARRGPARVVICDAESDEDLERIAAAALGGDVEAVALAGSSALVRAVWAVTQPCGVEAHTPSRARLATSTSCLTIVGTASAQAREQAAVLADETGTRLVELGVDELVDADEGTLEARARDLSDELRDGDLVVVVEPLRSGSGVDGRALTEGLARLVRRTLASERAEPSMDLILTGGETARAVLNAIGVRELRVIGAEQAGAVVSSAPDGRLVGTRPGSFGGADSLLRLRRALHHARSESEGDTMTSPSQALPVVAVTMGDGAGVGPEVTAAAVLDERILSQCIPVVIGDAARLRLAAEILGLSPEIRVITDVAEATNEPGQISVIDLRLLPADLPWGELSAVAGDAAYQYIKVAADLAIAGKVQAICTAPLNKEALHMGGHRFPGHTEMLAHLTGTEEVSMMLSSPQLRVIHVTTHIGLIDAIAKIEPGLVERTVRRGWEALRRAGIAEPKIGVCAINPHAGEGGLFGYGEEEAKIIPALEVLRADGIDADGPLPADTAFYLGGRGDYDLIVAMYHDQGHGPVKVLGIEAGVNITVGLPVIRTSVDHGTAFDIAGTGVVKTASMVEAMRQAVELASA